MIQLVLAKGKQLGDKICPPSHLDEEYDTDDRALIIGFQNFFVMTWTATQNLIFLLFLSVFLQSGQNEFMQQSSCCEATELLYDENGVPLTDCSQKSCKLYGFVWSKTWSLLDQKPRSPKDGTLSHLFPYDSSVYCCNLAARKEKCCDYLPWNWSCGFNFWGCCLAAMCGMLMTQVLVAGFYSIFARRNECYVFIAVVLGVFLKVTLFMITFYLFFGFVFLFLFFWIFFFWCDNPFAAQWYQFGWKYWYYFLDTVGFFFTQGVSTWDGYWDFDTMAWTHVLVACCIDVIFCLAYVFLKKAIKNADGKKMFDLAFFDL